MAPVTVAFVTGNLNKLREVREMIGEGIHIEAVPVDLPEYQGQPLDIASSKCKTAYAQLKRPVIIEDTGLCFNALGGLPGPYIKWFLSAVQPIGLYKLLAGFEDKSGYAKCIFAYFDGSTMEEPMLFDGRCHGTIVAPRGTAQFGWDPIFEPTGFTQTFAEMPSIEKAAISHRGIAFRAMKEYILSL